MRTNIKPILVLLCIILMTSCVKDDMNELIGQSQTDQDMLDPNVATSYLQIEDAEMILGEIPDQNSESMNFTLSDDSYLAVPDHGFMVTFKMDEEVKGIYLQVDGSDNYFDIPFSSADELREIFNSERSVSISTNEINGFGLQVNLVPDPNQGEFCAEISMYDAEGNISPSKVFCTTIKGWGGPSKLQGTWKYERLETFYLGNLQDTYITEWGETTELDRIECSGEIIGGHFVKADYDWMELLNSGDYSDNYKSKYIESDPYCAANERHKVFFGNWAYHETTKEIAIINFKRYTDIIGYPDHPDYYQNYAKGIRYIGGTVESVTENQMVIKKTYDIAGDRFGLIYLSK